MCLLCCRAGLRLITWIDALSFFARRTLPPIAWPAAIILVRSGRVAELIRRQSSLEIRPGALCGLLLRSKLLRSV